MTSHHRHLFCGFTLIELLITVAIMGILASVLLNSMGTSRTDARDKTRATDLRRIALELDMYRSVCHEYPDSLSLTMANGCPSGTTLGSFLTGTTSDPLGVAYVYATSSTGNAFVLRTSLEATSTVLTGDVDGATNNGVSLNCADSPNRYYCVGS
jgi:prepilin-type N-terminal cleavage/methylation domain-containing protein